MRGKLYNKVGLAVELCKYFKSDVVVSYLDKKPDDYRNTLRQASLEIITSFAADDDND